MTAWDKDPYNLPQHHSRIADMFHDAARLHEVESCVWKWERLSDVQIDPRRRRRRVERIMANDVGRNQLASQLVEVLRVAAPARGKLKHSRRGDINAACLQIRNGDLSEVTLQGPVILVGSQSSQAEQCGASEGPSWASGGQSVES